LAEDTRIGTSVASYRLLSRVGRGGMSVVYLALDRRTGNRVALKLLSPELAENEEFRERFLRESRISLSIEHPHIVPVYEAGEESGNLYIAMRYVAGQHLGELVRTQGRMELERTADILQRVAGALDAAHEEGLVHRDVKPGNILLGAHADEVYLGDFGLTKKALSAGGFTATGQMVGTIDYVAPEQIRGEPVDGRADVYSLGCVLYECLSGHVPFPRDREVATLWAHLNEDPPKVTGEREDVPGGLDQVIARAMAKDPADRYPTATALTDDLPSDLQAGGHRRRRRAFRTSKQRRRTRRVVLSAVAAIVVAGVSFVLIGSPVPGGGPDLGPNEVGRIRASAAELEASIPTAGTGAGQLAWADGSLWVANTVSGTVARIDPGSNRVSRRIPTEGAPTDIAAGEGAVWVLNGFEGEVRAIDPRTNQVTMTTTVPEGSAEIAVGAGSVWVTNPILVTITKIQPGSAEVVDTIRLGPPGSGSPEAIAVGEGAVWVGDGLVPTMWKIDPATDAVLANPGLRGVPSAIAVGQDGTVWVASFDEGLVTRMDPSSLQAATQTVGRGPSGIAVDSDAAWVVESLAGTVSSIDPSSGEVLSTVAVGEGLQGIELGAGSVWVSRPA
jgi:serine/threonine-protein kinase